MTKKVTKNKQLTDLEARDCRWPIGDPRQDGFHFCGAEQMLGRPYCAAHWPMAFVESKPRNRSAAPVLQIRQAA